MAFALNMVRGLVLEVLWLPMAVWNIIEPHGLARVQGANRTYPHERWLPPAAALVEQVQIEPPRLRHSVNIYYTRVLLCL